MKLEEIIKMYEKAETKEAVYIKALQEEMCRVLRHEIKTQKALVEALNKIECGDTFYVKNSCPLKFIGPREVVPPVGAQTYFLKTTDHDDRYRLIKKEEIEKDLINKISRGETIILWKDSRKFSELEFSAKYNCLK